MRVRAHASALIGTAAAVWVGSLVLPALALAQKGGGSVKKAGDNTADLVSGILGPVLIVVVAAIGVYGIIARQAGAIVTGIVGALVVGGFLFAPDTAQKVIEGTWKAIF